MNYLKIVTSTLKVGINQGLCSVYANSNIQTSQRILGGYMQTRDLGRTTKKRRTTHAPRWWVQRKVKYNYEGLTSENKTFLQNVIEEKTAKGLELSPLKEEPWERGVWSPGTKRTGVVARKIGIYPLWFNNGKRILTTLFQVVDNHVINYVPPEQVAETTHGFRYPGLAFLYVGAETTNPQLFSAAYNGLFNKSGVMTKRKIARFSITPNSKLQPGTPLLVSHFRVGDYVNVYGKTVGHGFQGVVKRWGFKGGRATHGTTKSHRRPGCIGAGSRKAHVWKGKKMPGHMGQERRLHKGLKVLRINTKYNVMWVKGHCSPGHVHAYVNIYDSYIEKKKHTEDNPPHFPTFYPDENEPMPEEMWDSTVHNFSAPTITFEDEAAAVVKK